MERASLDADGALAGGVRKPGTLDVIRRQREALQAQGKPFGPVVLERDAQTGATLKLGPVVVGVRGPSWEDPDVRDEALPDGELATKTIATLRAIADRPFFLAVDFSKPHLPFVAPKKYYDLYPADRITLAEMCPRPIRCQHLLCTIPQS
jgi:hypothetical protein